MSHNIETRSFPVSKKQKEIEIELNNYVKNHTWREGGGGLPSVIRWIDKTFPDMESAEEYIKSIDKGWYEQIAVKYKELDSKTTSKKLEELKEKSKELYLAYRQECEKVPAKDFKAELVGCSNCGSKISKRYIRSNFCPVCHEDMRSDTVKKKIENMKIKCDKVSEAIRAEENKLKEKHGKVLWLVKIEYHT